MGLVRIDEGVDLLVGDRPAARAAGLAIQLHRAAAITGDNPRNFGVQLLPHTLILQDKGAA